MPLNSLMTSANLTDLIARTGLRVPEFAARAGYARSTIDRYTDGSLRITRSVEMACVAVAAGLPGYDSAMRIERRDPPTVAAPRENTERNDRIRTRRAEGASIPTIGKEFNLSKSVIGRIVLRGRTERKG